MIELLAERLLRRHVVHGADQRTRLGHAVALNHARQAKIHHQDAARSVLHDVLRLQVAVNYSYIVCRLQSQAYLLDNDDCFLGRKL